MLLVIKEPKEKEVYEAEAFAESFTSVIEHGDKDIFDTFMKENLKKPHTILVDIDDSRNPLELIKVIKSGKLFDKHKSIILIFDDNSVAAIANGRFIVATKPQMAIKSWWKLAKEEAEEMKAMKANEKLHTS